ncbi:MAG: phosphoribosylformylglycinamidine cyclo-ligase [Deltaproteobacteria bacterium]|nr:phosphoribosylformylglycinamidine cyclo-ligase [Deltaproteobacteria bacterium]
MAKLTYRSAGVDIDAGDALVERIKPLARATRRAEVLQDVGGFAGLMRLPTGLVEPILVSGTDGVGTKLKIAFAMNKHDTIGQDLVAMCANDVATCGAEPLFFLDYYGVGKLDVDVAEAVIRGIAEGCKLAGCALLGGETAELPGMYSDGEYDLAGFCVGVVERSKIIDGKQVALGDTVLGVRSSGLHSNGFSLARKALLERAGLSLDTHVAELGRTLGEALLEPTKIYARAIRAALAVGGVHAMSHITGGGLPGNIPRVLPEQMGVQLDLSRWQRHAIFTMIQRAGEIDELELRRAFNLGLGLVVICAPASADAIVAALNEAGESASIIGTVIASDADFEERVVFEGQP